VAIETLMHRWPKCVSCGRRLFKRDEDVKSVDDAMFCSHECVMLWDNYLNWRASFRESSSTKVQIPKFPFFRLPHD
jgi:hypothetical protein